eukprot:5180573-Alexandrium_andersonii.AAC.1
MAASSWDEDCIKHLMARPEVQCAVGHMCWFGMTVLVPTRAGAEPVCTGAERQSVRKPTRWMSSSPETLQRACPGAATRAWRPATRGCASM